MPTASTSILAADAAFVVVFSVFVVAFVVLAVITLTWAVRRDRQGRRAWLERQRGASGMEAPPNGPALDGRGRRPRPSAHKRSRRR
jgi:hypothetical protein